jgi:hypothetical protein
MAPSNPSDSMAPSTRTTRTWLSRIVVALVCLAIVAVLVMSLALGRDSNVPVTGKVMLDGQPLRNGLVIYCPDRTKGNTSPFEPRGRIGRNGNYELETEGRRGAPPGWYQVAIVVPNDQWNPTGKAGIGEPRLLAAEASGVLVHVTHRPSPVAYDLQFTRSGSRK